jgi:hypothetical protein
MKDPLPRSQKEQRDNQIDSGFLEGLKSEWKLFWENIVGDEESSPGKSGSKEKGDSSDPFNTGKLEKLSIEQIKAITKVLSQDRALLNQKLEKINREIEESLAKAQSLSLVGGDPGEAQSKTSELNELGLVISEDLHKLDRHLKLARKREDQLKKLLKKSPTK